MIGIRIRAVVAVALAVGLTLVGCSAPPTRTVKVEDRPVNRSAVPQTGAPGGVGGPSAPGAKAPSAATPASGAAVTSPVSSGGSNAGRPGFYTVRPGDTLVKIGLDHGQNWRDIARWNQIENPNLIEVGQVLRVRPEPLAARDAREGREGREARPRLGTIESAPGAGSPAAAPTPVPSTAPADREVAASREATPPRDAASPRDAAAESAELAWSWPAAGPVLQGFDEQKNKGLDIGGRAGDPVLAAADGRVVYAGSALRGYGNLVIIKHNNTYLSAYAHNRAVLVKQGDNVTKGQKIAEMGATDADQVKLHFEIRRQGKPVDPLKLLPPT